MSNLPKPQIHFDAMLTYGDQFIRRILAYDQETRYQIINDPTGESCDEDLAIFARTYPTTYSMVRLALMYHWHQQQVVVVGPRMQEAFANTSLENIPIGMIQLPHPCFYLATPESENLMLWGGDRTGWHKVAGCYVAMDPCPTRKSLLVLAWGGANEKSLHALDDATFWFSLDLDKWIQHSQEFSENGVEFDTASSHRDINLENQFDEATKGPVMRDALASIETDSRCVTDILTNGTIDLDKALTHLMSNPRSNRSDLGMIAASKSYETQMRDTARKLMRIVVNTVLYMNSASSEVSAPKTFDAERAQLKSRLKGVKSTRKGTGKVLQKRLEALPTHRMVWIGPTIEQEVGGERDFTSTGRRGVSGHIRRGHWHQFRVGPMKLAGELIPKEERALTLKWMPPLWVGSAKEATGPRLYGVKEPEGD